MWPLLLVLSTWPAAHDNSVSFSRVVVEAERVNVSLRLQALSLLEVVPWADGDGDRLLAAAELEPLEAELGRYILEHYRLESAGTPLRPQRFPVLSPDRSVPLVGEWVLATWSCTAAAPLEDLSLEVDLFSVTSPGHLEFGVVSWNDTPLDPMTLGPGPDRWSFTAPGILGTVGLALVQVWLRPWAWALGLLVAALACGWPGRRGARPAVLLLVCVPLGIAWVRLGFPPPPRRPIELGALLAGAYLAADVYLLPRERRPWFELALFGILVGLAHGFDLGDRLVGQVRAPLRAAVEGSALVLGGALVVWLAGGLLPAGKPGRRRGFAALLACAGLAFFGLWV
jgi:hypothetical protein